MQSILRLSKLLKIITKSIVSNTKLNLHKHNQKHNIFNKPNLKPRYFSNHNVEMKIIEQKNPHPDLDKISFILNHSKTKFIIENVKNKPTEKFKVTNSNFDKGHICIKMQNYKEPMSKIDKTFHILYFVITTFIIIFILTLITEDIGLRRLKNQEKRQYKNKN
jgi:hypothetical protein